MKNIISAVWVLAFLVVSSATTYAWHVEGYVRCVGGAPFNNVSVNVAGTSSCGGAFNQTATTDSSGYYFLTLPDCAGSYMACVDTTALPSDGTLSSAACISFSTTDVSESATISWAVTSAVCLQGPPPCPACVDPSLGLGAASGCTVLELGAASVAITGPAGGLLGNVCIAPGGKLSMSGSEYITGAVELGAGATFDNSSSGFVGAVAHNVDLSAQIAAACHASVNDAALPCTQTYGMLDGKSVTTIAGGSGLNVICVQDVVLSGKQILLTGPADAKFIFNVKGKFVLTGGGLGPQIRVDASAGLKPSAALYNIIGNGQDVAFSVGRGGLSAL